MLRSLITAASFLISTSAAAHSFWLEPEQHQLEPGDQVVVDFKVGDGENINDWGLYWERIAALQLYGPALISDQQTGVRTTAEEEVGTARIAVSLPGSHILAFASNPSFSELEAERFNRYLVNEGLGAIVAHRAQQGTSDQSGTELYARRAKTLLQVGSNTTENVTKPIGQTLEIVPLENPLDLGSAHSMAFQVMWRGNPLEGALLTATPLTEPGNTTPYTTDADGKAIVALASGSRYLLSVVWGEPAPNDARADYFTVFSSLTFERN